ncbi:uncharacterized protein LOC115567157 [Sparus aurata]|uniref:uncharacterized protein LOC115567157 n=1 Tax=Sparus aurata TaxID=8175 RepID=UPI0011C1817A|nr:uncharacterized protein LOC115567157 [Sparus aurata]
MRTPSPAPSSVMTPSMASMRTPSPAPSSVMTPSMASVRTPSPAPSSMRTPSTASVRTPSPAAPTRQAAASDESEGAQAAASGAAASFWLPYEMSKTIPVQDQRWIANTLFQTGKLRTDLKLWYEPPVPALIYHQTPTPDRFFTHRLMVWMPCHLWKVRVSCPVCGKQLTGYGVHKRARKVLDVDRYYLMNHGEEWLNRLAHYLGECADFVDQPSLFPVVCQEPPEPIDIPTSRWLLTVYNRDIFSRLEHIKASITSTFGSILKTQQPATSSLVSATQQPATSSLVAATQQPATSSLVAATQQPATSSLVAATQQPATSSLVAATQQPATSSLVSATQQPATSSLVSATQQPATSSLVSATQQPATSSLVSATQQPATSSLVSATQQPATSSLVSATQQPATSSLVAATQQPSTSSLVAGTQQPASSSLVAGTQQPATSSLVAGTQQPAISSLVAGTQQPATSSLVAGTQQPATSSLVAGTQQPATSSLVAGTQQPATSSLVAGTQQPATSSLVAGTQQSATSSLVAGTQQPATSSLVAGTQQPAISSLVAGTQQPATSSLVAGTQQPATSSLVAGTQQPATSSLVAGTQQPATSSLVAGTQQPATSSLVAGTQQPATSSLVAGTQQPAISSLVAGTQHSSSKDLASPDQSGAVDDSGVPGLDRVDSLAEYLVGLRNQNSLVLTNQQVSSIVALWQNLLEYDKQRVVFAARHQSRLDTGRFRSPKKRQEFTPGVESVKRHALTTPAPIAQWPDCCRLLEMIFIRFCAIHRSPRKKGGDTVSRWDLILEDYRKVRWRILANGTIMTSTSLQLVDVSHTTLVQWHNKRVKRQDTAVIMQGLDLPSRFGVAANPLLPAHVRPASAPPLPFPAHQYHLPGSTVGQARLKRKVPPSGYTQAAVNPRPQCQLFPVPVLGPQLTMLAPMTSHGTFLFAAPQALAFNLSSAPPAPARKLTRKVLHNTCKKCGQFRTAETRHSQYKGIVYCPSVEALPKEQWLEMMKTDK